MLQLSNYVYCDNIFDNMEIENKILPNPYRNYPFMVIENFFSQKISKEIAVNIKMQSDVKKARVKIQDQFGIVDDTLDEKYRKTNIYTLDDTYEKLYYKKFEKIKPKIEEYFNLSITNATHIQALEYKKGFFYKKHADDSSELVDKDGFTIGFKNVAPSRKITTVLFGTSNCDIVENEFCFSGGELVFNYLYDENKNNITIKPKAGDMVIFPSNPYFSHEVLKVTAGYRLTLVQWHDALIL